MINFSAETMKLAGKLALEGAVAIGGTVAAKIGTEKLGDDIAKMVIRKKEQSKVEEVESKK